MKTDLVVRGPEPLEDQIERARSAAERARLETEVSLIELRDSLGDAKSWRTWVVRKPWIFLAASAVVGFYAGRKLRL